MNLSGVVLAHRLASVNVFPRVLSLLGDLECQLCATSRGRPFGAAPPSSVWSRCLCALSPASQGLIVYCYRCAPQDIGVSALREARRSAGASRNPEMSRSCHPGLLDVPVSIALIIRVDTRV